MAQIIQDSDYKCSLCETTLKKAKEELGEDPDTRIVLVNELRSHLNKVPGLKPRTDIGFLLRFLRARKFEHERAYDLVQKFYGVKKDRTLFDDLKPSRVKHVIEAGILEVLKERDNDGCRVVIMRIGKWDPDSFPMSDIPRAVFLVMLQLIEDEETQVHGVHLINNLAEVSWKQGKHVSPSIAKQFLNVLQNVLPLRMKRFDYVHEPVFFDVIFGIIRQFMSDKLYSRIHLNGNSYDKLHTTINPDHLPTDLGGKLEPNSYKEFFDEFLRSDARFEEDNKYGYLNMAIDSKSKKPQEDAGMQGMAGSFKKLDV